MKSVTVRQAKQQILRLKRQRLVRVEREINEYLASADNKNDEQKDAYDYNLIERAVIKREIKSLISNM